jgi:hypothetical protein
MSGLRSKRCGSSGLSFAIASASPPVAAGLGEFAAIAALRATTTRVCDPVEEEPQRPGRNRRRPSFS